MLASEAFLFPPYYVLNDAIRATQVFVVNAISSSTQDNRDSVSSLLSCLFSLRSPLAFALTQSFVFDSYAPPQKRGVQDRKNGGPLPCTKRQR